MPCVASVWTLDSTDHLTVSQESMQQSDSPAVTGVGAQPNRRPRIAVFLGFDARVKGGLRTMAGSFLDALDALGVSVDLYMPRMMAHDRTARGITPIRDNGLAWYAAGTIPRLPNFAAPVLPASRLRPVLRNYDLVQTIVGSGVWGLPGQSGRKNITWVATPFAEEFDSRVSPGPALALPYRALRTVENIAEGIVLRRCDRVLALSEKTRDILVSRHRLTPDRVSLLYAPIDDTVFYPAPAPAGGETFVTTSRLDDERKDVPSLVRAFDIVAGRRPNARLRLLGPYEQNGPVASAVAASPFRDRIDLAGLLDKQAIGEHLRASDVFVLSSRQEGLGIVALEAMACGVPVVAYTNGGTDEIIRGSQAGNLVLDRTPEALAGAMLRVLTDRDYAGMRRRAIAFVAERASPTVFRDRIADAYRRLGIPVGT